MRDRLPGIDASGTWASTISGNAVNVRSAMQEALSALLALGYKNSDAQRMLKQVSVEGKSSEQIIRSALQSRG